MNLQLLKQVIGVPFKDKGRDLSGFDCWGLVRYVLLHGFGVEVPSYTEDYRTSKDGEEIAALVQGQSLGWPEILLPAAQPGDVVVLRILGRPWHVGVLLERPCFVHADQTCGTVVARLDSILWQKRIVGVYRHPTLCR